MKAIGGYFELADFEEGLFPHTDGLLLNTGRNALEFILRSLGKVKRVLLPLYDCEVVLEPLNRLGIQWDFYHIDLNLEIYGDIRLLENEYIIVNNYFGIKDSYINELKGRFGNHLIADCAQALFAPQIPGMKSFYSTRKFVGVADGGIAYLGNDAFYRNSITETDCSQLHDNHLYIRKRLGAEAGFPVFRENEMRLNNQAIRLMSPTTRNILEHIDYDKVIAKRRDNFAFLHETLGERNLLTLPDSASFSCPMAYPYLTTDASLRQRLIDNKVFVATYWPNVKEWASKDTVEYELAERLIPLPIDQRYTQVEMKEILRIIG